MVPRDVPALVRCPPPAPVTVGIADATASSTVPGPVCVLGETEIKELRLAAPGHKDVGGLDVAVDDPGRVRGVERIRNVDADVEDELVRDRLRTDSMLERLSFQELHHDELLALELADVVDRADVRMIQGRSSPRFPLKAFDRVTVLQDRFGKELERDVAAQSGVLRLVDDAHAAPTQLRDHLVVRYRLADHPVQSRAS